MNTELRPAPDFEARIAAFSRWPTRAWLIALPAVPLVGLLAFFAVGRIRHLPRWALGLLSVFFAAQLVAALFTPSPLLSLGLAALRALLVIALLALGFALRRSDVLRTMLVGLGVVYLSALAHSWSELGAAFFTSRLSHPYFYAPALGMMGALGVWIAVTAVGGKLSWRVPVAALAMAVVLLSGSRGPLLALSVGLLAASSVRWRLAPATLAVTGTVVLVALAAGNASSNIGRLWSDDANGRDVHWRDVLSVVRTYPVGGVGPYQLGTYMPSQHGSCLLENVYAARGSTCPAEVMAMSNALTIAHNDLLQRLGEAGFVGLLGHVAALGLVLGAAWRSRDATLVAITFGLTFIGVIDNVTLPSVGLMEVFWLAGGMALARSPTAARLNAPSWPVWSSVVFAWLALPLWTLFGAPQGPSERPRLLALTAPARWAPSGTYPLYADVLVPGGAFRLEVRACAPTCESIKIIEVSGDRWQGWLNVAVPERRPLRLQLGVLPREATVTRFDMLATHEWVVRE